MPKKSYKMPEETPVNVNEPAIAYSTTASVVADKWNPNVPFHCTQEEFLEHIHSIEQGNFTPLEEANREFELWRKEYLAVHFMMDI